MLTYNKASLNQIVQTHSKPLRRYRWVPDFKPLSRNKCSNSVLKQCGNFALKIEMAKKGLDSLVLRHSGALEDEGKSVSLREKTQTLIAPWPEGSCTVQASSTVSLTTESQ